MTILLLGYMYLASVLHHCDYARIGLISRSMIVFRAQPECLLCYASIILTRSSFLLFVIEDCAITFHD
jgi:hypothetical protein